MRGRWFIAPHAVRRFIERAWPGATYEEALDRLIELSEVARLVRADHTPGVDLYRTPAEPGGRGRIRLLVSRRLPGAPQLVTILVGGREKK
jgi:hypothetical protein